MHPITKATPIYTAANGVNIYELAPTDFLNKKTGEFYYANFIIWQQLNIGSQPLDTKEIHKQIISVCNSSIPAQEKVSEVAHLTYGLMVRESLVFSKSLVLSCCSHFYYLDSHDPQKYNGQEVIDILKSDPNAYDFFLQRLEPLLANCLNISKKDTQGFIHKTQKALTLAETELAKLSSNLSGIPTTP